MKSISEAGYNERLFSGGLRTWIHSARFRWVADVVSTIPCQSMLELGCFDGKLLDFLHERPVIYKGFDAGRAGGLDKALRERQAAGVSFHLTRSPDEMRLSDDERFDVAVSMETLEHVPQDMVEPYLAKIAQHLRGHLIVTVPNEKGPVFLAKWAAKRLLTNDRPEHTLRDVFNQVIGRSDRVPRFEHTGFDYAVLVRQVAKYFNVLAVRAVPLHPLPPILSYGVGIIARSH
jgi:2-polyprenyl-3-methyl-5-hydroxy-6-metoxy-1,4-benzoquinol methylase